MTVLYSHLSGLKEALKTENMDKTDEGRDGGVRTQSGIPEM